MFTIEQINRKSFNRAINVLKEMEPTVLKDLRAELKNQLGPFATNLANAMPVEPPLSGLGKSPGYNQPKGKVGLLTGRKGGLVVLTLDPGANGRGFFIAELAGTRTDGQDNRGKALIQNLNAIKTVRAGKGSRKAGRFAWPQFRYIMPDAAKRAEEIVLKTLKKLEGEMY